MALLPCPASQDAFNKMMRVIDSCTTLPQLLVASRYRKLFYNKFAPTVPNIDKFISAAIYWEGVKLAKIQQRPFSLNPMLKMKKI